MNKVELVGRTTKDIDLRKTQNGTSVAFFSLAVNKDKDHTDFIYCTVWGKLAETMKAYVHKGDRIAVCGRIQTRDYKDRTGANAHSQDVNVETIEFLESRQPRQQNTQQAPQQQKQQDSVPEYEDLPDFSEADLPF